MTHSIAHKALAASALSLLLLTSCGEPPINKDADPAQVLKDARAHLVTSASTLIDKTATGSSKGSFEGNLDNPDATAKLNGTLEVSSNKDNDIDLNLGLNADVTTPTTGKITGSLSAELRKIQKIVFADVTKLEAKAEQQALQAQLDQYLAMAPAFTNKWMKFDLEQILASSPEEMAALDSAFKGNADSVKKALAKLNDNEIFTVQEKLAPEDGMYVYKVIPNKAGIMALVAAMRTEMGNTTAMTPEEQADFEQIIDALSAANVTHKLYIDGDNNYRKLVSTGTIDSSDTKADITSTLSLDKDLNNKWVVDVKAASATASDETITVSLKTETNNLKSTAELTYDAPFLKTKFTLKGNSEFKAGDVKIETPSDAADFTQMLGGAAGASATGATMPAENK